MTRVRLAVAGLAVAAAATLGVGASQAVAAAGSGTQQASAPGAQAPTNLPVIRGKYWTYDGCMAAGHEGVARGHWSRFQCANGTLQWVLWTDR